MEKKNSFDFLHIINKSCSKFKNKVFIDDQKEKKTFQEFYTESKKFRDLYYIRQYSENFITTDNLSINRNNGQLKVNGKL